MKTTFRTLVLPLLIGIFSFVSNSIHGQTPTVYTDQPDYLPGDTVVIEGDGWQPGEQVKLEIDHSHVSHGNTVLYATADTHGHIFNNQFIIQPIHFGEFFHLTAIGLSSLLQAQTTFTDGAQFKVEVTPNTGIASQRQTYKFSITNTNTESTTAKIGSIRVQVPEGYGTPVLESITPPSGKTWSFVNSGGYSNGYNSNTRQIGLRANAAASEIAKHEVLEFTVTISNPSQPTSYIWTTEAFANSGTPFSGTVFLVQNPPGQPSISIAAVSYFSNLSAPTITFGTSTTLLKGAIRSNAGVIPAGNIVITLNGISKSAAINSTTGEFSTDFATGTFPVGTSPYTISYAYVGDNQFTSITDATKVLTVEKKPVVITPDKGQYKIYGAPDPVFAFSNNELLLANAFTGSLTRIAGDNAGTYNYALGTLSAGDNYTLALAEEAGSFEIRRKAIIITPDALCKVYGTADPALTFTNSAALPTDAFTGTLGRAAGEKVAGGPYAYTLGNLSAGPNYTVSLSTATPLPLFAITPKELIPSFTAATKEYDGTNAATITNRTITDKIGADDVRLNGGTAVFDNRNAGNGKNVTATGFSLTGTDAGNYTLAYTTVSATADITPRQASVTPDTNSKVYGNADPVLTGTLSGFLTVDGVTAFYTRMDGETVVGGPYTISAVLSPADVLSNYEVTYNTAGFTIHRRTLTVTANNITNIQYSDVVPAFTTTISGFAGTDNRSNSTSGEASFTTSATLGDDRVVLSAPGTYIIAPSMGSLSAANYSFTFVNGILDVKKEDAAAVFNGNTYYTLPGTSVSNYTIQLSVAVKDITAIDPAKDPYAGNISRARVRFYNQAGTTLGIANVTLTGSDSAVGLASVNATVSMNSNDQANGGTTLTVYAELLDHYTGGLDQPQTITLAYPGKDFVTGGGFLVNGANGTKSYGLYAGTLGAKTTFGFTMKNNKAGTSLRGQANIIIRSNGRIYQIKSNAINTLTVGAKTSTGTPAYFNTKASLTDITDPSNILSLGGNMDLSVHMNDVSTGGQGDEVSFQLISNSQVVFSSNWNNTNLKTDLQPLMGGNIAVSSTATSGASISPYTIGANNYEPVDITGSSRLDLNVFPNPSAAYFNVKVESNDMTERIIVKVIDLNGRTIQLLHNVVAGQTLQIGSTYRPGVYFIEMLQGNRRKQIRLVKQPH